MVPRKNNSKRKVRVLNVPRTIVFILFIYIIICTVIYIYKAPLNHIKITGNNYVKDIDIIRSLELEDYPSYVGINLSSLKSKLEASPFIKNAKVSYGLYFTLNIDIDENIPMFIYKPTNKIVLSDCSLIDNDGSIEMIPTLLNQTPTDEYCELAKNLSKVKKGILYLVSEITYSPSYNTSGELIDNKRFLLSMSDLNQVYITASRADSLSVYLDVIATDKITGNGTLYLDGDSSNHTFKLSKNGITTTKITEKME